MYESIALLNYAESVYKAHTGSTRVCSMIELQQSITKIVFPELTLRL